MTETPQPQSMPTRRSLADMVAAPTSESSQALPASAWAKMAVLALLLLAMNYWILPNLYSQWRYGVNWTHCFIIPVFSLYLLYTRRGEILAVNRRTCYWGLPLLLLGICFQILSVYPIKNDWLYELNMLVVIFALVLLLAGPQMIKLTWVPILFLFFAMPIPPNLYQRMAYPLQELAARSSTSLLQAFGVMITNAGSSLEITSWLGRKFPIEVVEACSGVRSLMAFLALGVAMAYLEERPVWQRVIFVLCVVPVAVLCNVLRVAITCQMYVMDKPDWGAKFMHEFTGILMLIPAFAMLWLVGKILSSLFVEVEEEEVVPARSTTAAPQAQRGEMDQ